MVSRDLLKKLEALKEDLKVVKMELVENPQKHFLTTKSYECTLNNGKVITRESIIKNGSNGSAVTVLPVTRDMKSLLVVQPRVFTKNKIGIELPAGYIDADEEAIDAAKRELREETGFDSNNWKFLASYYQDQGCSEAFNYSYLALDCEKMFEQNLDSDEFIHYIPCNFEDIVSLAEENIINDAGSLIAIEKAKKFILR